jgi:hypothetical protein
MTPSSTSAALAMMAPWLVFMIASTTGRDGGGCPGGGQVAGLDGADHRGILIAGDVPDDRDDADRPLGEVGEVEDVVAGVPLQVGGGHDLGRRPQVALGVLDRDDAWVLGQAQERLGVDGYAGAPGNVVERGPAGRCVRDGVKCATAPVGSACCSRA